MALKTLTEGTGSEWLEQRLKGQAKEFKELIITPKTKNLTKKKGAKEEDKPEPEAHLKGFKGFIEITPRIAERDFKYLTRGGNNGL